VRKQGRMKHMEVRIRKQNEKVVDKQKAKSKGGRVKFKRANRRENRIE